MPLIALAAVAAAAPLHHDLTVRIVPSDGRIEVQDLLTPGDLAPAADGSWRFALHAGLSPTVATRGWALEPVPGPVTAEFFGINATTANLPEDVPLEGWRLVRKKKKAREPVEIRYAGVIRHEVKQSGEEYQRSFAETPGIVAPEGAFLAGASYWVPAFGDALFTFDLTVSGHKPPWDAVSQGRRTRHDVGANGIRTTSWRAEHPVDEVYLVAGPWMETAVQVPGAGGPVEAMALLRQDDPGLAGRYLQATRRYLELYESILPPYPYGSFALVENWWDTGYGMPGFTLLGPQVIRFPWVLTSSYPHELLHNWWGNGVYVDPAGGNWCEGLTAYLADHLFAENRGEDVEYRRAALQKYGDFVRGEKDFPLVAFGSRSSAASEAVGYGKALMVFHMMRRRMGDEAFRRALARFYRERAFTRASWRDLAQAFTAESGQDQAAFVEAWTTREGAPSLRIGEVEVQGVTFEGRASGSAWKLAFELSQSQPGEPFPLQVPWVVTVEGAAAVEGSTDLSSGRARVELPLPGRPLRLDVDPSFDLMRRLDPLEVPPALSTLMGAERQTFVLPAGASAEEREGWTALARRWAEPGEPVLLEEGAISALPRGENVWVLGWTNRWAPEVAGLLAEDGVRWGPAGLTAGGKAIAREGDSAVLVARSPADPTRAIGFAGAGRTAAIPGLARKLPHYTRYSHLAFRGDEPTNFAKGTWTPRTSPLVRNLTEDEPLAAAKLPARAPLARLPSLFDRPGMAAMVSRLASPELGGRGLGTPELSAALDVVEARLREWGLEPAGTDGYRQGWTWTPPDRPEMALTNVLARLPGTDPALPPVVVLAHIDHLGNGWPDAREGNAGKAHPGADDNASGVAVALDLARVLAAEGPRARPVLFAFTTGEEAGLLGARHLLSSIPAPFACVNLDTVGRLGDRKLMVVDGGSAREWPFIFMGAGATTGVQVAMVEERLDSSDQAACLEKGVPGVQVFSGPTDDYHRPSDTPDKIDAVGLVRVAEVAHEVVGYLADRREPLTTTLGGAPAGRPGGERKVSLGTMPDFAFPGPGVRVDKVMPGTGAEAAGIRAGDVVVAIDGKPVGSLKEYSEALKARSAGQTIAVTIRRGSEEVTVKATLAER